MAHFFKIYNSEEFYLEANKENGEELKVLCCVHQEASLFLFCFVLVGFFGEGRGGEELQTGTRGKRKQQDWSTG